MEKFCTNCGAPVGESGFCTNCGAKVINTNEINQPISVQTTAKKSMPFFLKAILIVLAAILVWFAVVTGASALFSKIEVAINSSGIGVVDENLLTVDIVIPAICFDENNPASSELTQAQKDAGFKSAKVNDDGSVTYTVRKKSYEAIKEEMRLSTQKSFDKIVADSQSIKSVECNEDFSNVVFKVNKTAYENSLDPISVSLSSISCKLYQAYAGIPADEIKTVIAVVDEATAEVISNKEYLLADAQNNEMR